MVTDDGSKLNGSVDLLAEAMRRVFGEAVQEAVEPIGTEVKALRTEVRDMRDNMATKADIDGVEERLNERIDTTNENMQAQLARHREDVANDRAQHRKDVADDVRKIVRGEDRPE